MSTPAANTHPGIIRLNLAPEVYQNSQRQKRVRQLATTFGIGTILVAVGVVVAAGIVLGGQAVAIKLLQNSISSTEGKISGTSGVVNAVTAQQHLTSWQQLLQQRVYLSRFFAALEEVAPQGVAISNLTLDQNNNLQVTASAPSYTIAAKFAQSLQASNSVLGGSNSQQSYFSNVQLSTVSSDQTGQVGFQLTTQMSNQVTTNGNQ